jgi:NAD(P)-dependent dehydrogenase (short-subunit alcohol dehydrogenase family)
VSTPDRDGLRLVVIGASSGIGAALAEHALGAGAQVGLVARRRGPLETLAAGGRAALAVADVTVPGEGADALDRLAAELGPFDVVVYCVGVATLVPMAEVGLEQWLDIMTTNVVAFNHLVPAVLGHLAPAGILAALSSEVVGRPRSHLGPYGSSKAALDQSVEAWRVEHP